MRKPGGERERVDEEKMDCIWDVFIAPEAMWNKLNSQNEMASRKKIKANSVIVFRTVFVYFPAILSSGTNDRIENFVLTARIALWASIEKKNEVGRY